MKNQFLKMAVVTLLVLGVFAGNTWAKKTSKANEPSKQEYKEYKGTIVVTRDKAGSIKSVELKSGKLFKHTYHIVLDEDGRGLGEKMAGKKVSVKGKLEEKAGVKWLTIEHSEVSEKNSHKK